MNKHSGNVLFFHFYPHDLGLFKYPFRSILSLPDIADAEDAASMHLRAAFVLSLTFNVRAQSQSTVGENQREAPFAAVTRPASSSAGVAASLLSTRISYGERVRCRETRLVFAINPSENLNLPTLPSLSQFIRILFEESSSIKRTSYRTVSSREKSAIFHRHFPLPRDRKISSLSLPISF